VVNNRATVTDRLAFDEPTDLWWFAHTGAQVTVSDDGRSALLELDGKTMRATVRSSKAARLVLMEARPLPGSPDPEGQNPNNGAELVNTAPGSRHTRRGDAPKFGEPDPERAIRKLAIRLEGITRTRIEVRFEPVPR